MTFLRYSSFPRQRHPWMAGLLVLALAVRGIIPLGYMPSSMQGMGNGFQLTICDGLEHHAQGGHDNSNGGDHAPCPFSVNAVFGFSGIDLTFAVLAIIFLEFFALPALRLIRERHFGNASPRAPPLFV